MCHTILIRDGKTEHYVTEPDELAEVIGRENIIPAASRELVCLCGLDQKATAAKVGYKVRHAREIQPAEYEADWYWDRIQRELEDVK